MGAALKYVKNIEIAIITQWTLVEKTLSFADISFKMLIKNDSVCNRQLSKI